MKFHATTRNGITYVVSAEVFAKIIEFAAPRHAAESGHLGGPTTSYPGPVFAFSDLVRTGSIIGTVETQHALLSPDQIIWEEAGSLFALSLKYFDGRPRPHLLAEAIKAFGLVPSTQLQRA